ncbi:hypothetical protein B0J14DRAFT_670308 [Halenospora varia]|nr:hypothetical protein B0J14DRAFT_670308 [Halenospora varia]
MDGLDAADFINSSPMPPPPPAPTPATRPITPQVAGQNAAIDFDTPPTGPPAGTPKTGTPKFQPGLRGKFQRISASRPKHEGWSPLSIHTARCDSCSKHNKSVMQRCTTCNRQLCRLCIVNIESDGVHIVRMEELNWDASTVEKKARGRGPNKKEPAIPGTAVFHRNSLMSSPGDGEDEEVTPQPKRAKVQGGRGVPVRKEALSNLRQKAGLSMNDDASPSPVLATNKRGKVGEASTSSPTKTTSMKRAREIFDMESSGSSDLQEEHMSNERLDMLYDEDRQRRNRGDKGSARLKDIPEPAPEKLGRGQYNMWTPAAGADMARKAARQFGISQEKAMKAEGGNFDEVLKNLTAYRKETKNEAEEEARLARERHEEQRQMQIKEAEFQREANLAWLTNRQILELKQQGKLEEAAELFSAARHVMRFTKGLPPAARNGAPTTTS